MLIKFIKQNPIILLALCILISACSSDMERDDVTYVTGVCKSCVPYFCRGSWHYPQMFYEYDEEGLASWYGSDCHGKHCANGERFNKFRFTAAHKTLPLPSVVLVTNLDTGKSIKLVITDRGPYVYDGRIIDLSEAAAKKIGSYCPGVSRVRVQTLVKESQALSNYLAKHKTKKSSWKYIYDTKIRNFYNDTPYIG